MSLRSNGLVARIAEQLGFLMPVGELPDDTPCDGWMHIALGWQGPDGSAGSVEVCAEPALARALAANLLGRLPDEPVADDEALSALGELANVIAGNLLPQLYGDDHEFHLAPPTAASGLCRGRREAAVEFMEGKLVVGVRSEAHNTRILRRRQAGSGDPP